MDILNNIDPRYNYITMNNSSKDYIATHFSDYFGYISDSDIDIVLYPITTIDEYNLYVRYRNMIDDKPNINSQYLKYMNLTERKSSYNMKHAMAKSLVYMGWHELGCYFTQDCKARFKLKNKFVFDYIYSKIQQNDDLQPYAISCRSILDYIMCTLEQPHFNEKSFFRNETRKIWYTIEDKQLDIPAKYKIKTYLPRSRQSNVLAFYAYLPSTSIVPKHRFYKIVFDNLK